VITAGANLKISVLAPRTAVQSTTHKAPLIRNWLAKRPR